MDIEYKGGNCTIISTKHTSIVVDPKISIIGLKDHRMKDDEVQLVTQEDFKVESGDQILIDGPGEYEIGGISIQGLALRHHMEADKKTHSSTAYRIEFNEMKLVILGHVHPSLSDDELESIGVVDVLILPVGGNGYTLDAVGAAQVARSIDPKIIIPTHYADPAIKYPVPQNELDLFVKELGCVFEEVGTKLKLKDSSLGDNMTIRQIKRS